MKFGTGFALTAQADPIALRDMAQTLDEEGFDYVTTAGHLYRQISHKASWRRSQNTRDDLILKLL